MKRDLRLRIHGLFSGFWALSLVLLVSSSGFAEVGVADTLGYRRALTPDEEELFCGYLRDDLWSARDAYDSAAVLLIPLEFSFLSNLSGDLRECFKSYFNRLVLAGDSEFSGISSAGHRLQHLHLVSRYVRLSADATVAHWLKDHVDNLLLSADAWQWEHDSFEGILNRVEWKLDADLSSPRLRYGLDKSYYFVLHDQDLLALALGMEQIAIHKTVGGLGACNSCQRAKLLFERYLKERISWVGDGWVVDVGKWRDHHTYSMSAYLSVPIDDEGENLPKRPRENVVQDSSHFHRFPSILSAACRSIDDSEFLQYLQGVAKGLSFQLLNVVLETQYSRIPVMKNYMDGWNGYYRWDYSTHGSPIRGYGPYMLSGTFAFGWWALLGGEVIVPYQRLRDAYPLNEEELALYADASSRPRHPAIGNRFTNGLMRGLAKMAVHVAASNVNAGCAGGARS